MSYSFKSIIIKGYLAGSVGRVCESWSWGLKFESHTGGKDFLNILKKEYYNEINIIKWYLPAKVCGCY